MADYEKKFGKINEEKAEDEQDPISEESSVNSEQMEYLKEELEKENEAKSEGKKSGKSNGGRRSGAVLGGDNDDASTFGYADLHRNQKQKNNTLRTSP